MGQKTCGGDDRSKGIGSNCWILIGVTGGREAIGAGSRVDYW